MKNKHGNNYGGTISTLNLLREPDHEYIELYTKMKKLVLSKLYFNLIQIGCKCLKEVMNNGNRY